jgi:hypothetical protein
MQRKSTRKRGPSKPHADGLPIGMEGRCLPPHQAPCSSACELCLDLIRRMCGLVERSTRPNNLIRHLAGMLSGLCQEGIPCGSIDAAMTTPPSWR